MATILKPWDESAHAPKGSEDQTLYVPECANFDDMMRKQTGLSPVDVSPDGQISPRQMVTDPVAVRNMAKTAPQVMRDRIIKDGQCFYTMQPDCKRHPAANYGVGCLHVYQGLDPLRPEKIYRTPAGVYLCATCFKLMERRKLKAVFDNMGMHCFQCMVAEVNRIKQLNPENFVELRKT